MKSTRSLKKGVFVHGVEALGIGARQLLQAGGDDLQAGLLEAGDDLADDVLGDGVGLDDRGVRWMDMENSENWFLTGF